MMVEYGSNFASQPCGTHVFPSEVVNQASSNGWLCLFYEVQNFGLNEAQRFSVNYLVVIEVV